MSDVTKHAEPWFLTVPTAGWGGVPTAHKGHSAFQITVTVV